MATTEELNASITQWRAAAEDLLTVAEAAAPLPEDDISGLSLGEGPGVEFAPAVPVEEEVERRIHTLIETSDNAIALVSYPGGDIAAGFPVLLGALEISNTLLQASASPDAAFEAFGVNASGDVSLSVQRAALDEFTQALLGHSVTGVVPMPDELMERLETLETTGAEEILALGGEAVLSRAIGQLASGAVSLAGAAATEAFDWLRERIQLLRRAAIRILEWTLAKFRSLIPEEYRDTFDKKVTDVAKAIQAGAKEALANTVGYFTGRRKSEEVWQAALDAGTDLTAANEALPGVITEHLARVGYVSRGRTVVAGAVGALQLVTSLTGPQADLVVGAVVAALIGFVWFQLVDGFNDIEHLVPAS